MNICIQVFVWTPVFNSLGFIPRSGITESYGNYSVIAKLFIQCLCYFVFLPATYEGFKFSRSSSRLVIFCYYYFLILSIQVGVKWYLIVVLICISLMALSIFSYACWPFMSPLWRMSIQILCPLLIGLFTFCCWIVWILNILWTRLLSGILFVNIFSTWVILDKG